MSIILGTVFAQQDPRFTLFNYNGVYVNPALAGSKEQLNVVGLYRHQWTGYGGAPHTTTFTADVPILALRSAVGLSLMNESIGIVKNNYIGFTYAVIAHTSTYGRFSVGCQLGANQMSINYSEVTTDPSNSNLGIDPSLNFGNNLSYLKPQLGIGLHYYDRKVKFGVSIPSINSYNYYGVANGGLKQSHYFITGGVNFRLSPKIEYNPRVLMKLTSNAPMQIELFNQFIYQDKYTLGLTLRSQEAVAGIIGIKLHKQLNIAYAYDAVVFNKINGYQSGSHEIMINYLLPLKNHDLALKKMQNKRKHKCVEFEKGGNKKKLFQDIDDIYYDRN